MIIEISFKDNPDEVIKVECDEWHPIHASKTHEFYKDHVLLLWIHFDVVRWIRKENIISKPLKRTK